MSVRTSSSVWDRSQHSGTSLLMLLAIADFADDDGRAYPSVATLARKCRMKDRNAQYILSQLIESGELTIQRGIGPRGCNVYKINLKSLGVQPSAPLQQSAYNPCNAVHITPATECTQTVNKPSMNHQHGFDKFWTMYPKKKAKGDAEKAWRKLRVSSELLSTILKAIEAQKQTPDWQKESGQFIPYPASWLNGQRWEDEPGSSASGMSRGVSLRNMPGMLL